jgi:hypothetical protein
MHGTDKRMSQPVAMKTNAYVGGVETVNGHDAWAVVRVRHDVTTVNVMHSW